MKKIAGGVTAANGFLANETQAGIKYVGRSDMALVYSIVPTVAAGTFTTNVVKAAPVRWDMKLLAEKQPIQAVVLNSGTANACTGEQGDINNQKMAEAVAEGLGIAATSVWTASTGVIGRQLPMDKVTAGAAALTENLEASLEAGNRAAKAIMTTDTVEKECAVQFEISGKTVTLGGMSKGSGMIHPNMATMLGVITTDAVISQAMLQKATSDAVKKSFNMISVDRDTSTNDSLMVMANGLAENAEINAEGADYDTFYEAMLYVLTFLAKKMAADGEGASKLIECKVINAASEEQAVTLSKSVITSNLTKAAVYGNDANWGRILCAMGYSGVQFDPDKIDLTIEGRETEDGPLTAGVSLKLVENGVGTDYSEEVATEILKSKIVTAIADMKCGSASATAWGCDLTHEYVNINADYRS